MEGKLRMTILFTFLAYFPCWSDKSSPRRVTDPLPLAVIIWTMPHNCANTFLKLVLLPLEEG